MGPLKGNLATSSEPWSPHITHYFLQLSKFKIRKCNYFRDQRPTCLVMAILLFHEGTRQPLTSNKMKKAQISLEWPRIKNKGTLFSSTFKVEDKKVQLFSWSEANLISYDHFVASRKNQTTPHKSQNHKKTHILPKWPLIKKMNALYCLQL